MDNKKNHVNKFLERWCKLIVARVVLTLLPYMAAFHEENPVHLSSYGINPNTYTHKYALLVLSGLFLDAVCVPAGNVNRVSAYQQLQG